MERIAKTDTANLAQHYLNGAAILAELAAKYVNVYSFRDIETDHPMVDFEFQWLFENKIIKWTKMSVPIARLEVVEGNPQEYRICQVSEKNKAFELAYTDVLAKVNRYIHNYLEAGEEGPFEGGDLEVTPSGMKQATPITRLFGMTLGEVEMAIHYRAILNLVQNIRRDLRD